jgi:DNA-binding MarR family transcriptional regulator
MNSGDNPGKGINEIFDILSDESGISDEQARWIFSLFFLSYRSLIKDGDAYLAKKGLGRPQFRVMFILKRRAGYTMTQIKEVLGISSQAITRVLKQLLVEGYVKQELSIEDRRIRHLYLTKKGKSIVEGVTKAQKVTLERALAEEGEEKFRNLNDYLLAMLTDADRKWMQTLWQEADNRQDRD